jgi:hypothetical protein
VYVVLLLLGTKPVFRVSMAECVSMRTLARNAMERFLPQRAKSRSVVLTAPLHVTQSDE